MIKLDKAHTVLITMPVTQWERHLLKDLTDNEAKMCNNDSSSQRNGKPKENIKKKLSKMSNIFHFKELYF